MEITVFVSFFGIGVGGLVSLISGEAEGVIVFLGWSLLGILVLAGGGPDGGVALRLPAEELFVGCFEAGGLGLGAVMGVLPDCLRELGKAYVEVLDILP